MENYSLIAAVDAGRGIGRAGRLPWHLPEDLRFFKETTLGGGGLNAVIMGRNTWESIPERFRPLSGRLNIVLTRHPEKLRIKEDGVAVAGSLDEALARASRRRVARVFVIGGAEVYAEAITRPQCRDIFLTRIGAVFDCDAFFPDYTKDFHEIERSPDFTTPRFSYCFARLVRNNS
jgi:dihydrofolate reductase